MEPTDLESQVRELAARVKALEDHVGVAQALHAPASTAVAAPDLPSARALSPVLGRALLGLAGAYLLRSFADTHAIVVPIGILYALGWLVCAARASERLDAALHALTSALVLSPLLFESVDRFHAVNPLAAAAILLLFTVFGLAISWRRNLLIVATIPTVAAIVTGAALLVATHDVLPFTFLFLAIAAAIEASACLDHWLSERWLAAVAANLAVVLATWLVSLPTLPEAYAPIPNTWLTGAQVALLAIYLASIMVRTLFRGRTFTVFEIAQCVLAFAITVPRMPVLALAGGAACYALGIAGRLESRRNFYTYSTFGFLLVIAGTGLKLHLTGASMFWAALALACFAVKRTLEWHGGVYLVLALVYSGTATAAGTVLLSTGALNPPVAIAAAVAVAGYLLARTHIAFAIPAAWMVAAVLAGAAPPPYRTAILALAALLLVRTRLAVFVYPTMALAGYRLLALGLHEDSKPVLFLSLFVYGATLILLPKLRIVGQALPPGNRIVGQALPPGNPHSGPTAAGS